ncbi:MAG: DUF58 domain-containing protein [Planctomycetota bacterium]
MPATTEPLLSPKFISQLDRLDVRSRRMLRGKMQGERRSKKRGQSVEFADYRSYVVGDDLRRIDWNLYARLDKLFLRLFLEEEDLQVSVILDVSKSMDYGEPSKLHYGKQLAAALCYIALTHQNRTALYTAADTVVGQMTDLRGRRPIPRVFDFLESVEPVEGGNLEQACKRFALLQQRPGVVILISDFFDKGELADALRYLAMPRYDCYAIQLLSPQEVDPAKAGIAGDLRLTDLEDGDGAEVSVSPALLKKYQARLEAYCQHVQDTALRRDIAYLLGQTDVPIEELVLKSMRQRGLLG